MPYGRLLKIVGSRSKRLPLLFECLLCQNKLTSQDIEDKKFYPDTSICKECYVEGAQMNPRIWCFGKLQIGNKPGYSESNVSCRLLCPDRRICHKFINKLKTKEK